MRLRLRHSFFDLQQDLAHGALGEAGEGFGELVEGEDLVHLRAGAGAGLAGLMR